MLLEDLVSNSTKNSTLDVLPMQGLNLGTVVETTSVLRYDIFGQETEYDSRTIEKNLLAISRLITRDRWQRDLSTETVATRVQSNLQAHFADFSSYILPLLQKRKENGYLSLFCIWCDYCQQYISRWFGEVEASSTPSRYYHCNLCRDGDFDICTTCFGKGKRCKIPSHALRMLDVPSVWIPYTNDVVRVLEAHATNGHYEGFSHVVYQCNRRTAFFKTSQAWRGTVSLTMEPGDIIVVLFGSRVPFVLRKHGSAYRLVSDCYIQGAMDGEAIDMWKNGELKPENFEIQ